MLLTAAAEGLQTRLLLGQLSPERALELIDAQLDRIFTEPGPHLSESFMGVDPRLRGQGVARALYEEFFRRAAEGGRREVRAVTAPTNTGSIAFHRAMGFELEAGDRECGGLPIHTDYDGPGQDRVCFHRMIISPGQEVT